VNHLTDDELVLHFYDEDGPDIVRVERHLGMCVACARTFEGLARTLRAVTPPAIVEAPDDTIAIRQLLLERARERESSVLARMQAWLTEPRAIALAWLVPVLYPLALPAIFAGSRSEDALVRGVLVVLALLWACAGPAVAVVALKDGPPEGGRGPYEGRPRVLGAVLATITPALFMVVARGGQRPDGGQRLDWWYAAIAGSALLALVPWPAPAGSTPRLKRLHRLTSVLLGLFILGHVVNQSIGFVSVPSYAAMRGVMQLASEQSVSYVLIIAMAALQIFTGAAMGLKRVTTGAFARNLQAVSGWYLAVFLFAHVLSPYLARAAAAAPVGQGLTPPHLLASASAVAALPFYLLGVSAFLLHIGLYARLAALGWLAESSVRRLSYATAVVGATVVVTVGLSLCGIHLIR
jgi:succinate dehydrogenase/fumarate reductase cytochrome b subunit